MNFVKCWSVFENGKRLLSVATPPTGTDLGAIHGIRFLSMAWIILGHTFYFGFALMCKLPATVVPYCSYVNLFSANPNDVLDVNKHGFFFQAILQAVFAVDTFFLLSGCLLAYTFFPLIRKQPEALNSCKFWASFYLHRIWR